MKNIFKLISNILFVIAILIIAWGIASYLHFIFTRELQNNNLMKIFYDMFKDVPPFIH